MKYPIVLCDNCKQEFEFKHSSYWLKRSKHYFCDRACYYEWRKDMKNTPRWNGGEAKMLGYVFVKVKDHPYANDEGYVKRSRLVMEQAIGRYLKPEETIHHINQIRDDDRLENLMLYSTKSEHMKNNHHRISIYPLINTYGAKELSEIFNVTDKCVYRWLKNPVKTKWMYGQLEKSKQSNRLVLNTI